MPRPKLRPVNLDEVKITREGDTVIFEYADVKTMGGGMHLKVGEKIHQMTDAELLQMHNDMAEGMIAERMAYDHVNVEVPVGKSQIEYSEQTGQWCPKGDVLRCYIAEGKRDDGTWEPVIEIDGHKLTWEEFGRSLLVHSGWGMRLAFVPDDKIHEEPRIVFADSTETYLNENRHE